MAGHLFVPGQDTTQSDYFLERLKPNNIWGILFGKDFIVKSEWKREYQIIWDNHRDIPLLTDELKTADHVKSFIERILKKNPNISKNQTKKARNPEQAIKYSKWICSPCGRIVNVCTGDILQKPLNVVQELMRPVTADKANDNMWYDKEGASDQVCNGHWGEIQI